jgi:hypothetical protein
VLHSAVMKRQRDDYGGNQYGHDGSYGQVPKRQQQGYEFNATRISDLPDACGGPVPGRAWQPDTQHVQLLAG